MDPDKYKTQIEGCDLVVAANYTDILSMNHALLGADFAFLVPRSSDTMDVEQFKKSAKKLADAAKGANLKHSIWYTIEGADALNGECSEPLSCSHRERALMRLGGGGGGGGGQHDSSDYEERS